MQHKHRLKLDLIELLQFYAVDSYTSTSVQVLASILINQLEDIAKQNIHK